MTKLTPGRAHYSGLLTEQGTYVDDLLVYRLGEDEVLLVVNAANLRKDREWILERRPPNVTVEDRSEEYALLALQGPLAKEILSSLTPLALDGLRYYRFAVGEVAGRLDAEAHGAALLQRILRLAERE